MLLILFAAAMAASAEDFPSAEISNGAVRAKLYLPDPARGYYRGTRFDWSGQIASLRAAGHEYFGQWFPKYDPNLHDSIMGPVEEYRHPDGGLGYGDAKPGGTFIRIGIGVAKRPDDKAYQGFKTYEIVDPGKWRVRKGRGNVRFTHELASDGYAYRYTKVVRLVGKEPRMVIEHELRNTGTKPIRCQQYNHNFFVMDGQPTGPASSVKFPFELRPIRDFAGGLAQARGKEIRYDKELETGQSVYGEFDGFGPAASDYDLRVENAKAGAGVRIRGDIPLAKVVYWSIRTVFSPEPYVNIEAEPGKTFRWTYTYDFYDLKHAAASR